MSGLIVFVPTVYILSPFWPLQGCVSFQKLVFTPYIHISKGILIVTCDSLISRRSPWNGLFNYRKWCKRGSEGRGVAKGTWTFQLRSQKRSLMIFTHIVTVCVDSSHHQCIQLKLCSNYHPLPSFTVKNISRLCCISVVWPGAGKDKWSCRSCLSWNSPPGQWTHSAVSLLRYSPQ